MFDALIIGGGPAGATTGLLLARAGWSVAIIEKKTFPRRKVCGEFISATNLSLLQDMGIADFYLHHSGPEIQRVGLFAADSMIMSPMPPLKLSANKWGRALGREHLDTILLNEACKAGATAFQPWTACQLQRHSTHFTCTITDNTQTRELVARKVIVANGSWERSVTHNPIKSHKKTDFLAFKAHFQNSHLDQDLMPLIVFPGGYGGLVHSNDNRVTLSCCIRRDTLQKVRENNLGLQAGDAVFQHIKSTCLGVNKTLKDACREASWLSVGPIQPGIRPRYANGLFFVGNSAGEAHPVIAEGISMAIQSAGLLSSLLIQHQSNNTDMIGKLYSHRWKKQFANRIRAAALFAQLAIRPTVVTALLPIIKQFPSILTYGARLSGKTMLF